MALFGQQLCFYSTNGTPVYLGLGSSGAGGTAAYQKEMAIHIDSDRNREWSAVLNEEATLQLVALLGTPDDKKTNVEPASLDRFQASWLMSDDDHEVQLQFTFKRHPVQFDFEAEEWREWEDNKTILFAIEVARDMAEYTRWGLGLTKDEPQFWKRNAIAIEICNPNLKRETALESLDDASATDALRIIGNVTRRGRVDLAVELLHRLHKRGLIELATARNVKIYHAIETPVDVSWNQLFHWAGLTIHTPRVEVTEKIDELEDLGYSSSNYLSCFEDAFEEHFENIDFETMDFRDVQARLRHLTEDLERHFSSVHYPEAEPGTVIPNIALGQQQTRPFDKVSGEILIQYTPTLPYNDARKLLLFAHKICIEDPLLQILDPVVRNINNRPFEVMLPPQNVQDIFSPRSLRVEPGEIHDGHFSLLRETLVNTQRLAKLIRARIVIPHHFIDVDITEDDWNAREYPRWPNRKNRHAMEDAAAILGDLLAQGCLTGFGFPDELADAASVFRGSKDQLDGHRWIHDFFLNYDGPVSTYPPLGDWVDFLYRIMMYDRYHEIKNLRYSQHFAHPDGYKLLSIMEAIDLAQSERSHQAGRSIDRKQYAKQMTRDEIRVHRLESNLKPNVSVLSDEDIIQMRLDEELFEEWRRIIRESLQAIETYNAATGNVDGNALQEEIRERMNDWSKACHKRQISACKGIVMEAGKGVGVSVVTSLLLGDAMGVASLVLGAAYTIFESGAGIFNWRNRNKLINRHFLSVT